jgi:hypothetical protein
VCQGCGVVFDALYYIQKYYGYESIKEVLQIYQHLDDSFKNPRNKFLMEAEAGTTELLNVLNSTLKLKRKIIAWNGSLPARTKLHTRFIQKARHLPTDVIELFDLRYDMQNNRVGIPIVFQGQMIGLQWRNFQKDEKDQYYIVQKGKVKKQAKYYIESGTPKSTILFGFDQAKEHIIKNNEVIVVEGAYCCMSAHAKGFPQTVATLGAQMSEAQASILTKYTSNVTFCYDDDAAGREGVLQAMITLGEGIKCKVIPLCDNKDVYDMTQEEFARAYQCAKEEDYDE